MMRFTRILSIVIFCLLVLATEAYAARPFRVLVLIGDQWKDPAGFMIERAAPTGEFSGYFMYPEVYGDNDFHQLTILLKSWGIPFDVIHIKQELVQQSVFGELPTFAIWLEDPGSGETHTVFATRRVATGDWEGKKDVPVALPLWSEVNRAEVLKRSKKAKVVDENIIFTGATPLPGYFRSRVRIAPESKWICWIEMNLAGDYNEAYPRYDPKTMIEDEFSTSVFDEISIKVVRPKPRIIQKPIIKIL